MEIRGITDLLSSGGKITSNSKLVKCFVFYKTLLGNDVKITSNHKLVRWLLRSP